MKLKFYWILVIIAVALIVALFVVLRLDLIDLRTFVTWVMAGVVGDLVAGIVGYILGKREGKAEPQEIGKAFAEESQKLKSRDEAIKAHKDVIYHEILKLLEASYDFEVQSHDTLDYPKPDQELLSHLEAYGILNTFKQMEQLCNDFNDFLDIVLNYTVGQIKELIVQKGITLQLSDTLLYPDSFFSPKELACDLYHKMGSFQPYKLEPISGKDGWFKIGNTVTAGDNKTELESLIAVINDYALTRIPQLKSFNTRRKDALDKTKEFFEALQEIRKKLESGHLLKGQCYLCPNFSQGHESGSV
jgi:hypothetical protein